MPEKLKIDLPILLPDIRDARDACVSRLISSLEAQDGIDHAHIIEGSGREPAQLCVHYRGDVLGLARIRRMAENLGASLTDHFGHVVWKVEGVGHIRRARTLADRLRKTIGIVEGEFAPEGLLRVEFNRDLTDEDAIRGAVGEMGIRIVSDVDLVPPVDHPTDEEGEEEGHTHGPGDRLELIVAALSGVLLVSGWLIEQLTELPDSLPLVMYLGAYALGGFFTLREAIESVRIGRFEIDFLMLVAAIGAAALGEWAEGALLLFLFSLGHGLEHYAMGRARRAIEALAELVPETAIVRRDGREEEIPVRGLEVGDTCIVKTNQRIPCDGFVVKGTSSVNQAPVTGESMPVDKQPVADLETASDAPGDLPPANRVFAGTINGSGSLEIFVTKTSAESAIARVVKLVSEAETEKSPTQRLTDRFERVFVPVVLSGTVLLLFAWLVVDESFSSSFYRAMSVLVAASPCALAIATPSAVLSGVARAGRSGVLVKGGGPLESLGTLRTLAFDKTGTLTEGRPRLTDVVPFGTVTEEDLLATAVAVERLSDHPLATAVVQFGLERLGNRLLDEATDLESLTGRGIKATLQEEAVYIGKRGLFEEPGYPRLPDFALKTIDNLEKQGRTTVIVHRGHRFLGVLALMDTPRESAAAVIAKLRLIGIEHMVMLSGDNQRVADAVASQLGLDEAFGDLLPEEKVEKIREIRGERSVAMVGDGVNDAPAMANATVGIAMGAAGSDVAMETADVALMADDLFGLPFAVGLSRKTSRIIKQNLWISLGVVAVLVPATIIGLGIGPAVAAHEGSTLVVVFNALRLLAYE